MNPDPRKILIHEYDYNLPEERIAQYPLERRDQSKLLIVKENQVSDDYFSNIAELLPGNSTIIFNETKVVHARLVFHKPGGSRIEVFCLEPAGDTRDYQLAFHKSRSSEWTCLIGNAKRWKSGSLLAGTTVGNLAVELKAERVEVSGPVSTVRFSWDPPGIRFSEILEHFGKVPLPPYINREAVKTDEEHYQTVYARDEGSVAAPTAGLHFTDKLLRSLDLKGLRRINFTLHVGAGTFRPVVSEQIGIHEMHPEQVYFELESLKQLYSSLDRPVTLVGTTSARMMESLYWHGVKLSKRMQHNPFMDIRQWDPYDIGIADPISREKSLGIVIDSLEKEGLKGLSGETRLIIVPGYRFRYPDILITNFHQPKSTLLLLVAAFAGDIWKEAYRYALDHDFRFLSYGDSCMFYRAEK